VYMPASILRFWAPKFWEPIRATCAGSKTDLLLGNKMLKMM
jgi:hypothetical protein